MKKVYAIICLVVALAMTHVDLKAQGSLGLYTTSVSNSNPAMNEQISLFTKLINTSATDTFNGIIDFSLANENGTITDITVFGKPAVSGNILTLAPLQEINLLFTVTPKPAYFVPGPDIIIVWPIASAPVVDSAKAPINIQEPTGIEQVQAVALKTWINDQQLTIQLLSKETSLQRVQIFNTGGMLMLEETITGNISNLPIGIIPKGIYIIKILMNDGSSKTIKLPYYH